MNEIKGLHALSFGAIACNAAVIGLIGVNTNFSNKEDLIAFFIAGFGLFMSLLYAVQLILMNRAYFRHHVISISAKIFLHICRIITLLYALFGAFLLAATVYNNSRNPGYLRSHDYKFMASMALLLVTVVLNFTIFFKGWRLLKMVKRPYIDKVIASFD
jgi:hypothetical protein